MKKACFLALILSFIVGLAGCGFTEGTDAVVTIVHATPTPTPEPTPTPAPVTPTPEPTPTPAPVFEQTPGGVNVQVVSNVYTTNASVTSGINLRQEPSTEGAVVAFAPAGAVLNSTGVCDNGWIRIEYEGQVCYASGELVMLAAAPASTETQPAPEAEAPQG